MPTVPILQRFTPVTSLEDQIESNFAQNHVYQLILRNQELESKLQFLDQQNQEKKLTEMKNAFLKSYTGDRQVLKYVFEFHCKNLHSVTAYCNW